MPSEGNEPLRPVLGGSEKDTTRLRREEEMAGGQRAGIHRKAALIFQGFNFKRQTIIHIIKRYVFLQKDVTLPPQPVRR